MQVTVENTSEIGRRLTITVPANEVRLAVKQRMDQAQHNVKLDGFRPGKAPKDLVQKKYGPQIRNEAVGKIIETTLPNALQQESLEPAGRPEIEKVMNLNEDDKDLTYIVNFEVFPEINLPDFTDIQVEKSQVNITDEDVDRTLKGLQEQMANWTPVDRPAAEGDKLRIDYTSLVNGKPYENSAEQNAELELGSQVLIEGLEKGLIGAKAGETRELDLHFPSHWRIENLAGKPVHFSIQVKEVAEKHLAQLDEAFANRIGVVIEPTTDLLFAIRNKVRENLDKQIAYSVDEQLKKQALDKLLTLIEVPVPKALVQHEMTLLHEDLHRRMGDKAHETCHHMGLEEEAKRRVSLSLVLRKIVKLESLKPSQEKIREKIASISKSFGNADFIEKMYYESEELFAGIQNTVLVDQAVDLILTKASVALKPVSVETFFKQSQQSTQREHEHE